MISDIWEITMFGYINVLKDELKIKDYNVFRAFYCGLCKTQGEIFGNLSRISLSYDFTFLAILLSSLNGESCEYFTGKCMLHPLHKRSFAKCQKDLEYCSYMSMALSYYKIKDDINDRTFSKNFKETYGVSPSQFRWSSNVKNTRRISPVFRARSIYIRRRPSNRQSACVFSTLAH